MLSFISCVPAPPGVCCPPPSQPYRRVFHYYRTWRKAGVWQQVNAALRQQIRQSEGRHPEPSAAIISSQSIVKTTEKGGRVVTMPAKVMGRQRHIVVDRASLLLAAFAEQAIVRWNGSA